MSVQFSRQGMAAVPLAAPAPKSSFVRRLLEARNDPAKARILAWLLDTDNARLQGFGITPEDIALLRGIFQKGFASEPSGATGIGNPRLSQQGNP